VRIFWNARRIIYHKDIDKLRSDPNAAIPARSLVKIDMDTLVNGDIDVIKYGSFLRLTSTGL